MHRNLSLGMPRRQGERSPGLYRGVALGSLLGATALFGGGCGEDSNAAVSSRSLAQAQTRAGAEPEGSGPRAIDKAWKDVPLPDSVEKAISWLLSVQGEDGGFGQDGGHGGDARTGVNQESQGNDVANTSIAGLALLRAGVLPRDDGRVDRAGPKPVAVARGEALSRAVAFVLSHVEAAPVDGLAVTTRTGTQIQRKLGAHIDTFLATRLLSQVDGLMPTARENERVHAALSKCSAKVEKNQREDGSWNDGSGWATVISTSMAARSLTEAKSRGIDVKDETLSRVDRYTAGEYDGKGGFRAGGGSAGVSLYQIAQAAEQSSRTASTPVGATPAAREAAAAMAETMMKAADTLVRDEKVLAGFGSMGGEEFVSYMNVSDGLCRRGGESWSSWNGKIKTHVEKLQNADGTWAGHHCITGRTACTSAAVLTLLAERTGPRS